MTTSDHSRQQVLRFLRAIYARDTVQALACVDDEYDFVAHVPVQLFPHLGRRHGKAQLAETLRAVQKRYGAMRHEMVFMAAEADQVATIMRVHLKKRGSERILDFLVADFYTLRNGLIAEQRQFVDSFDLVQQVLEREVIDDITMPPTGERLPLTPAK
jgi:ketosteroid isomerase-like protein